MISPTEHEKTVVPASEAAPPAVASGTATTNAATPHPHRPKSRWVAFGALVIGVVLAGLLTISILPRLRRHEELTDAAATATSSLPRVVIATARRDSSATEQTLPGNSQAFRETALYARTNGYLKEWLRDIGDRVKEGELIAEISAPDLDDQLTQAKANLEQARATLKLNEANADLAEKIMDRYLATEKLTAGAVAQLLIDEQRASVETSKASVVAARASVGVNEATVQMYTDLQGFEKIVAPFAGVITARNVDPGALVTADNPSATRELFHLMQTDPLRVFVDVPQVYATSIKVGETAEVYRPGEPGTPHHGKVTRTANALDPNTRTLLTQIDVPNPDDALRPGMYLLVKFVADRSAPAIMIPSAALVIRGSDGQQEVAVLGANNVVEYRKVQLGRDSGAEVEVVSGLQGGETVIVHPGDALAEGQQVEPVSPKKAK